MKYSLCSHGHDAVRDTLGQHLAERLDAIGFERASSPDELQCVLNLTDLEHPRPFRRESRGVLVVSVVHANGTDHDLRSLCYAALVRSLSNVLICISSRAGAHGAPSTQVFFTTPEAGFYAMPNDPDVVFERMLPLATAQYATTNTLHDDLPNHLWMGSGAVDAVRAYARELDTLGVLPTPFPLRDLLSPEAMRHLFRLFEMTGLSYGNLSVRERIPDFSESSFWMTARGVDKAHLGPVGTDILLVRSFDQERGVAHLSMPPSGSPTARVSVDAVEHAMIYERCPGVNAIVHVHAWLDDIVSTRQNYPCGTRELAEEVCAMLERTSDPGRAVVGLKNHGITVTGPSFEDIFSRLRGRLRTEVPMYA